MEEDRLKIPSTKRVCFVARTDSNEFSPEEIEENIREMVKQDDQRGFVARSSVEAVRNGTQVPRNVLDPILKWVADRLLGTSPGESNKDGDQAKPILVTEDQIVIKDWNPGGRVFLGDLAGGMPPELMDKIKGECSGGLQTILRNHNYMFVIERGGMVRLRNPMVDSLSAGKRKR